MGISVQTFAEFCTNLNEASDVTRYGPSDFELAKVAAVRSAGDRAMAYPMSVVKEGDDIVEAHQLREALSGPKATQSQGVTARVYRQDNIVSIEQKGDVYEMVFTGEPEEFSLTHSEAREIYGRAKRATS